MSKLFGQCAPVGLCKTREDRANWYDEIVESQDGDAKFSTHQEEIEAMIEARECRTGFEPCAIQCGCAKPDRSSFQQVVEGVEMGESQSRSREGSERVILVRSGPQWSNLGINVAPTADGESLRINWLDTHGLIPAWNAKRGSKPRIEMGSHIVGVNDVFNNAALMVAQLRNFSKGTVVHIYIAELSTDADLQAWKATKTEGFGMRCEDSATGERSADVPIVRQSDSVQVQDNAA